MCVAFEQKCHFFILQSDACFYNEYLLIFIIIWISVGWFSEDSLSYKFSF